MSQLLVQLLTGVCVCRPVDVWAVGCLTMEMLTGQPLFPGNSDLDQIYQIIRCVGENAKPLLDGKLLDLASV